MLERNCAWTLQSMNEIYYYTNLNEIKNFKIKIFYFLELKIYFQILEVQKSEKSTDFDLQYLPQYFTIQIQS